MSGKRFDVLVPEGSTVLLEQLARESSKTGITEARLLVQFALRYAEMVAQGEAVTKIAMPMLSLPTSIAPPPAQGTAANGHREMDVVEAGMRPLLNNSVAEAYLEDD